MATLQPVEYKQYSYGFFEQKHYMECTTQKVWGLRLEESRARDTSIHALDPQLTHLDGTHNLHGVYFGLKG
jgi:hypothetical protein